MKQALVAVGAFVALVVAAVAVIAIQTIITGDDPRTSDPGDRSRVYYLDAGDCFDAGPTFDERVEVTVLDCDEPHDSEVVWSDSFSTYGSEGEDALREARDEAVDECREELDAYVDALPAGSDLERRVYLDGGIHKMRDLGTDERKWTVGCVVWDPDGDLSGGDR